MVFSNPIADEMRLSAYSKSGFAKNKKNISVEDVISELRKVEQVIDEGFESNKEKYASEISSLRTLLFLKFDREHAEFKNLIRQISKKMLKSFESALTSFSHPLNITPQLQNLNDQTRFSLLQTEFKDEDIQNVFSDNSLHLIKTITDCLLFLGEKENCETLYKKVRGEQIFQSIQAMEFKEVNSSIIHKNDWKKFVAHLNECSKNIFILMYEIMVKEKLVYKRVFKIHRSTFPNFAPFFSQVCEKGDVTRSLFFTLKNAQILASTPPSPEKLFPFLELFAFLKNVKNSIQIEGLYLIDLENEVSKTKETVSMAALQCIEVMKTILKNYAVVYPNLPAKKIFNGCHCPLFLSNRSFSKSISNSNSNLEVKDKELNAILDAKLIPMTRFVINFVIDILKTKSTNNYHSILESVYEEFIPEPVVPVDDDSESAAEPNVPVPSAPVPDLASTRSPKTEAEVLLNLLYQALLAKARLVEDSTLQELFLMNNTFYIYRSLQECHISLIQNSKWMEDTIFEKHTAAFQFKALNQIMDVLVGKQSMYGIKSNLKKFNQAFQELEKNQKAWWIFDEERRKKMKYSWSSIIKNAYSDFLQPHTDRLGSVKDYRFTPILVEKAINDNFFNY